MAQFGVDSQLTAEQVQNAMQGPSKGYAERQPYRQAFAQLQPGQVLRITPSTDKGPDGKLVESLRAIQFRILGAAKDIGINVKYGKDNVSDDVLVWLDTSPDAGQPSRRSRRGKANGAASANGTADAESDARQPATV